jgi:hypothetical protein
MNAPRTSLGTQAAAGKPQLRPFGSVATHDHAMREVNRWFADEWQKLLAEKRRREREIERKFWAGECR